MFKKEQIKPLSFAVTKEIFPDVSYDNYTLYSFQDLIEAFSFLLDNFVRFGVFLYKEVMGIPIDTICAPFVPYVFVLL